MAVKECDVGKKAVIEWYHFCRQMCAEQTDKKIGRPGHTVEVDESKFCKAKYNRGRNLANRAGWVFGGVDRDTKDIFMCEVPDRTSKTLIQATLDNVELGTTIMSDKWNAYNKLSEEGFEHDTVNHSKNFVNPVTGAHTQTVEAMWFRAKKKFKAMNGTTIEMKPTYYSEFVWKEK